MNNQMRYLRLTDYDNRGTVIKQEGRKFYGYKGGEWKRRGLSVGYFYPDAPEFECYEVISEEEAIKFMHGRSAFDIKEIDCIRLFNAKGTFCNNSKKKTRTVT
jgi:hypothetical protein